MFKIKDSVNLKELEKYGFEYQKGVNGYYKVYFPKFLGIIPIPHNGKIRGLAIYEDRKIIIKKKYGFAWIPAYEDEFAIKDLIQAGLVEKMEEKHG